MTSILRIYLADGWPDRRNCCEWALLDAGMVIQRGHSAPEHWPASDITEGMLDPSLVGSYFVKLPVVPREKRQKVAAYALEEQLLEDPDRYHFVIGPERSAATRIFAVPRAKLQTQMAALGSHGHPLDRLVAVAELLPQDDDDWLLWESPANTLVLQTGQRGTCLVDNISDVGRLMAGASPPPARLKVIAGQDLANSMTKGWPIIDGGSYDWALSNWHSATQLLTGDFQPARCAGRWQKAMLWCCIALGLYTVNDLGEWAVLSWRHASLKDELQEIVRAALPGRPLVAPMADLVNIADRQQHRRGESGIGDFLYLAERTTVWVENGTAQSLDYENGRLTLQLDNLDARREEALRQALTMAGLDLRIARQRNAVRLGVSVSGDSP